jgi:hypothetical protein
MTLDDMKARLEALLAARWRGVRSIDVEGRRISYATDAEMASAITDLEKRIAVLESGKPLKHRGRTRRARCCCVFWFCRRRRSSRVFSAYR